jgi:hypothetical protein
LLRLRFCPAPFALDDGEVGTAHEHELSGLLEIGALLQRYVVAGPQPGRSSSPSAAIKRLCTSGHRSGFSRYGSTPENGEGKISLLVES